VGMEPGDFPVCPGRREGQNQVKSALTCPSVGIHSSGVSTGKKGDRHAKPLEAVCPERVKL
jgi:hypothetical protein